VGWGSAETIASFVGWFVLTVAFVVIEMRSRSPLVPLSIFRRRTLTGANIIGFILGTMMFGMFFLLSLYMQQVLGFSPIKTGVGYLAVALTAMAAATVSQALVTRMGVKPVLLGGLLLFIAGLGFFTQISVDGTYFGDLFLGFVLIGIGLGCSFVPVSIAALAGVTGKEAGLASGLINTNQQIGGALGLAILTTVSTTRRDDLVGQGVAAANAAVSGFRLAFWVTLGFAVVAVIATMLALKRDDLVLEPGAAGAGAIG
jgi:MFS family permease